MIYTEVNFSTFTSAFHGTSYNENFSYDGKRALFDYLEQFSEETGENVELDIIGLCCDYTEYGSEEEVFQAYDHMNLESIQELEDHTTVIEVNHGRGNESGYIIQNF